MNKASSTKFVERFRQAWLKPDLALHENLWAEDVVLTQPIIGRVVGRAACREAFARLFRLIPDLHADVHRWSGRGDELFIEITLAGTFGGRDRLAGDRPLPSPERRDRRATLVL
jgi:ketosteroid isomerase-like protein